MELKEVEEIAKSICFKYDYPLPSKIILDKRYKYCMAYTHCEKRIIRINDYLVHNNPEPIIRAVVAHEIVHFKHCHHGPSFAKEVQRMGSRVKVQSMFELINLPFKYIYKCPACGAVGYGNTKRDKSCGDCTVEYDERYKLVLIKVNREIK